MNKEIESQTNKLNKIKEDTGVVSKSKQQEKKSSNLEHKLKMLNSKVTAMKMKSTFVIGLFVVVTISSLSNYFGGFPVARLPFQPISLMHAMTHRGLIGEDYTECSYIFLYMVCSFVLRQNIQKFFGWEGPKGNSPFMPFGEPPKFG